MLLAELGGINSLVISVMGGEGEFLLLGPTIGDKIVQTLYSNSAMSENQTIRTPPYPLHSKLLLLFFVLFCFP